MEEKVLDKKVWGRLSNLPPEDQEKIKNHDNLPAGATAKIIRKVYPTFGKEGEFAFRAIVTQDNVITVRKYYEVLIAAQDKEEAEFILNSKINDGETSDFKYVKEREVNEDEEDFEIDEILEESESDQS